MIEFLKLLSIVLAPLLLVFPIVIYLYKTRHKGRVEWSFWKYCRTFDAIHGLGSQPLFSIAIVYPIGLFVSTGIWAWSGYNLDISSDGFIKFIELSKLSLGLLGLSIPFGILTARLHGTKQTALQIEKANEQIVNTEKQIIETQQKNKTDLYLAHYKHFCDHVSMIEKSYIDDYILKKDSTLLFHKKQLYKLLYPNSSISKGIGVRSMALLNDTQSRLKRLYSVLEDCHPTNREGACDVLDSLHRAVDSLLYGLSINNPIQIIQTSVISTEKRTFLKIFKQDYDLISLVDFVISITDELYDFDIPLTFEQRDTLRLDIVPGALPQGVYGKIDTLNDAIRSAVIKRRQPSIAI